MTHNEAVRTWGRGVLLVGLAYCVVGLLFGPVAGAASSNQARVAIRLAAWAISFALLVGHVRYELFRLRNSAFNAALHSALAVAIGAFCLAVAAMAHARTSAATFPLIALLIWPA